MLDSSSRSENTEQCLAMSLSLDRDRFSCGKAGKSSEAMRIPRRTDDNDFVKQPISRTVRLPRRAIWKDKGGSARYVLRDEPALVEELKPLGYGAAAKEAMTDALLSGSVAGLAVLETVEHAAVATRRHLDRHWASQKRLSGTDLDSSNPLDNSNTELSVSEGVLVRGRRGLLRRAKSLSGATGLADMQRSLSTAPTAA